MNTQIFITNVTTQNLTLDDFYGKIVLPGEQFLAEDIAALRSSTAVALALLDRKLQIYNGSITVSGIEALNILHSASAQVTKDGKSIITASDRPKDTFRYFSGRGDDIINNKVGFGDELLFSVNAGQTVSKDIKFNKDVYIKDGCILFENAALGSFLTIEAICPPNTPFPSLTKTGTLDLVNGSFVPNNEGTGAFMTVPIEIVLNRFINRMYLLGSGKLEVTSPESFMLNSLYYLRYTLYNSSQDQVLRTSIMMGMYRATTV